MKIEAHLRQPQPAAPAKMLEILLGSHRHHPPHPQATDLLRIAQIFSSGHVQIIPEVQRLY